LFSGISYEDTDGIGVFNGFLCINIVPVFYVMKKLNIMKCFKLFEKPLQVVELGRDCGVTGIYLILNAEEMAANPNVGPCNLKPVT
jgi:hypothetical protein